MILQWTWESRSPWKHVFVSFGYKVGLLYHMAVLILVFFSGIITLVPLGLYPSVFPPTMHRGPFPPHPHRPLFLVFLVTAICVAEPHRLHFVSSISGPQPTPALPFLHGWALAYSQGLCPAEQFAISISPCLHLIRTLEECLLLRKLVKSRDPRRWGNPLVPPGAEVFLP